MTFKEQWSEDQPQSTWLSGTISDATVHLRLDIHQTFARTLESEDLLLLHVATCMHGEVHLWFSG